MSRNRFDDEFTVHVISSASMQIFGSNTLASFRNFFNDEIQLAGDWRVALSEIIFPTKIEHVVNGDLIAYSLKGYEDSQKISSDASVISRPYNGEKLSFIILFKSPRDVQQIGLIGRQLNNTQFLKESYELATKQPFGHLLIDLDPKTSDVLRYCSNIVPPGPSIFYLPSAKAVITNLTNETERTMYAAANASVKRHQLKKTDKDSF